MLRHKLSLSLLCSLLCCLLIATAGLCATSPAVVPVGDTQALVVHAGGETLLVGGEDAQQVQAALSEGIDYVVRLCSHSGHSGAADALAASYGVPVLEPGTSLPISDASWQGDTLQLDIGGTRYVLGVDAELSDAISYRCDGTFFPYSGKTNELAVNVRESPSTSAGRVGRLERGELLTFRDLILSGDGAYWYEVELADGTTGYIRSDLVVPAIGEEAVSAQAAPASSQTSYIGNKKSKVFHRTTCWTLPAEKNRVYFDSRDDATDAKYRPCKNCNP